MRKSITRLLLVLLPTALLVVVGVSPAQAARTCTNVYRLQASNGLYVAAETGRSSREEGMLRARTPANALGTWEEFAVFEITGAPGIVQFSLRAHNGRFADTWQSYGGLDKGMLRASAANDNNNDQRFLLPNNSIRTGEPRTMKSSLNLLNVASEQDFPGDRFGMLRARTPNSALGSWELFTWHYVRDC